MKSGIYKVEVIDKKTALLKSLDEESEQYTFPMSEFTHEVTAGDVVEIWLEGTKWRTKYLEEETKSAKSHLKDFKKRIFEED
ncbi:hypothetical protein [Planomicrobium sp. Y74]|uniref:hypothetical protein n=1 Tax=Planomicrobium sp. Y74 TaxID=2478977 RepID=UPI000EF49620|nr:hypothetical protein [Planomicrobium sp. Y74]RLQ84760.1 hypothetical protein D9754_16915 [Planomicrobium sp. Y74]